MNLSQNIYISVCLHTILCYWSFSKWQFLYPSKLKAWAKDNLERGINKSACRDSLFGFYAVSTGFHLFDGDSSQIYVYWTIYFNQYLTSPLSWQWRASHSAIPIIPSAKRGKQLLPVLKTLVCRGRMSWHSGKPCRQKTCWLPIVFPLLTVLSKTLLPSGHENKVFFFLLKG